MDRRKAIRITLALALMLVATVLLITALGFGFGVGELRLTTDSEDAVAKLGRAQSLAFTLYGIADLVLAGLILGFGWFSTQRLYSAVRFVLVLVAIVFVSGVLTFAAMALSMAGLLRPVESFLRIVDGWILSVVS